MWGLPSTTSTRRPSAFTLIEMIVALVILAIMAALTLPRMIGNDKREFRLVADQVADLLTMYAQRQNLGQKVVGIYHDRPHNWLELMVIDSEDGLVGQATEWHEDRYVKPVKFPSFMLDTDVEIFADGDRIDASYIPLSSEIGQERPQIQIALRGAGQSALLTLHPYGVAPELNSDWVTTMAMRSKVDLDGAGRSREDW